MRADLTQGLAPNDPLKERDGLAGSRRFIERSQRREGQGFGDFGNGDLREVDMRASRRDRHPHSGMSPPNLPVPIHGRNGDQFPRVDIENPEFRGAPPGIHSSRSERFHERPEVQRAHSSRAGVAHPPRPDVSINSPRLSPHALRNDAPLPQRHEYPGRDRVMNRGRNRGGAFREGEALDLGDREPQPLRRDGLLPELESPVIPEDRELRPTGPRDGRSRHGRGQQRQPEPHSYVGNREFDAPEFPERHPSDPRVFSGRDRGFPREQEFPTEELPFRVGGRDFEARTDDRFQQKDRRNRGFEPHNGLRDQRLQEPMVHGHGLSPHERERLLSREDPIVPPGRAFGPLESQRRDPPSHTRVIHNREREQGPHIPDRTSRTWERGVEVPTPPPEQGRFDGRGREPGGRKDRREGGVDVEYAGPREDRRRAEGENPSTYENERKGGAGRHAGWATREADTKPSPRGGPAPLRMDMEVDSEPSPASRNEPLPGWAGFRQRTVDTAKSSGDYWARREGPPGVAGGQDQPGAESEDDGRKRRKIDNGPNLSAKFGRDEQEPRKRYVLSSAIV